MSGNEYVEKAKLQGSDLESSVDDFTGSNMGTDIVLKYNNVLATVQSVTDILFTSLTNNGDSTGPKRYYASSIEYNGKMYVFGGSHPYKNDLWSLDLTTNVWTEITTSGTKPSARRGHTTIIYDGWLVVFGGYDGSIDNNGV